MDLLHLLVADYANLTREGKLNVMGIFNRIFTTTFPARHPEMYVIAKLSASPAEYGQTRRITIKLLNEDATEEIVNFSSDFQVPREVGGQRVETNHILQLRDTTFQRAGSYQFSVIVDNDEKGSLSIYVVEQEVRGG